MVVLAVPQAEEIRPCKRRTVKATSYPIYIVIDRDGNIAGEQSGAVGERALRRLLARVGIESADQKKPITRSAWFGISGNFLRV